MNKSTELADRLEREYQALIRLFAQFCQQAAPLADRYQFFGWPDYEDAPAQSRLFTLLGEERSLELHCHPAAAGELTGHIKVRDAQGQVHAALTFQPSGQLLLETGNLLDDPPALLLRLLLGAVYHDQPKG